MLNFKTREGETIRYGGENFSISDEKAYAMSLKKQLTSVDPNNQQQVASVQHNLNSVATILGLDTIPEHGMLDELTAASIQYFKDNDQLFLDHGIRDHMEARKLQKVTNPAFTETEYPPTIEEMKALEVNLDDDRYS